MVVFAREIFLGFSRYYNSLSIMRSESLSTHTGRLLSYLDQLGRMLGYRILSEYTLKNLMSHCPKAIESKKIDIIWDWEKGKTDLYELAVESQQNPSMALIKKDIIKLVNVPAKLKVLYCAARNHKKVVQTIRNELRKGGLHDNFLAIIDPWVGSFGFSEGILEGILLRGPEQVKGKGTAKVQEINDGTHGIRMFLDAKWQYVSTLRKQG